ELLPAPLAPTSAVISPPATAKSTRRTASISPYRILSASTFSMTSRSGDVFGCRDHRLDVLLLAALVAHEGDGAQRHAIGSRIGDLAGDALEILQVGDGVANGFRIVGAGCRHRRIEYEADLVAVDLVGGFGRVARVLGESLV